MKLVRGAQLIAIFFTGLFSGLMLTFWLVIQRMLMTLPGEEYTRIMQRFDSRRRSAAGRACHRHHRSPRAAAGFI